MLAVAVVKTTGSADRAVVWAPLAAALPVATAVPSRASSNLVATAELARLQLHLAAIASLRRTLESQAATTLTAVACESSRCRGLRPWRLEPLRRVRGRCLTLLCED